MKPVLIYSVAMVLGIPAFGCSKEPQQTPPQFSVNPARVAGNWVLAKASPQAKAVLTPDDFPSVQLHLFTNGEASYEFMPVEEVLESKPVHKVEWTVDSSRGSWTLEPWQEDGRGVWRMGLQTPTGTIPFRVEKDAAGGLDLVYYANETTNVALLFKRAR